METHVLKLGGTCGFVVNGFGLLTCEAFEEVKVEPGLAIQSQA